MFLRKLIFNQRKCISLLQISEYSPPHALYEIYFEGAKSIVKIKMRTIPEKSANYDFSVRIFNSVQNFNNFAKKLLSVHAGTGEEWAIYTKDKLL